MQGQADPCPCMTFDQYNIDFIDHYISLYVFKKSQFVWKYDVEELSITPLKFQIHHEIWHKHANTSNPSAGVALEGTWVSYVVIHDPCFWALGNSWAGNDPQSLQWPPFF